MGGVRHVPFSEIGLNASTPQIPILHDEPFSGKKATFFSRKRTIGDPKIKQSLLLRK